ncbi:hypothetical protein KVT40_001133 [Elsinoe batatas]|uniref:Uncharacterized protein n=1 Tax=Elsinoe batatas TaxID=2601811 RepID=A0A8K0PLR7_9PEZI|nr:hypothetical protein KVT40_001133 [Elsinoe batatas]
MPICTLLPIIPSTCVRQPAILVDANLRIFLSMRLLFVYSLVASWYVLRASAAIIAASVVAKSVYDHKPHWTRQTAEKMVSPDRAIYTAISHLCTLILGGVFGSRISHLSSASFRRITFINSLVLALYFMSAAFVFSAALLQTGLNIDDVAACNAAVYCCVVFYFMSKGFIQLFLIERAHAVRAHKFSRRHDRIYIALLAAIICGFGSVMVAAMVWPIAEVSGIDGICRIGLPVAISGSIIAADMIINAALTGVFVWLLRPLARNRTVSAGSSNGIMVHRRVSLSSATPSPGSVPESNAVNTAFHRRSDIISTADADSLKGVGTTRITNVIERQQTYETERESYRPRDVIISRNANWIDKLILKSTIGTVLVILPTIANLGFLAHQGGRERAWICLTFCTVDVTWAVLILHWLTIGSPEPAPASKNAVGVV